ncbi:MAG: phosphatase PAP2 family protein [Acidimicrobiia bacterium]
MPGARRIALLAAAAFAITLAGVFLGLLVRGPLSAWIDRDVDHPARSFSESHNNETAVSLSRRLDDLGEARVTGAIAVVAGAVLWGRRRTPRPALLLASGFVGAAFITVVVKRAVSRQPASGPIPGFSPGTFPSGHTLFALTVYGCLAVLVLRSGAPALVRWATASVLLGISVAIGLTRVYLLDHFLTDVLGSILLGITWVLVAAALIGDGGLPGRGGQRSGDAARHDGTVVSRAGESAPFE